MRMRLHRYELPLRHTFTTSHGSRSAVRTLVVELTDGEHSGYGEAPEISYYHVSVDGFAEALESARQAIEAAELSEPAAPATFWEQVRPHLADCPFALCAVDEAAHDLWGKRLGRPVHELWGLSTERVPPSDYTIGLDTPEAMVRKLEQFPGFPVYKIKLGTDHDVEIVRELRRHTDATFRVDANGGWDAEQAVANAHALRDLGVEFIEQPLPAEAREPMRRVFEESALPVIADESCIAEPNVDRCRGLFHGINIKLTKCGGMTPARRMIGRARELGMTVMVGCMTESTVGISAIAQLLPLLDCVDMDGALLLGRDIASGVRVERGRVIYPDVPGCGVRLLE